MIKTAHSHVYINNKLQITRIIIMLSNKYIAFSVAMTVLNSELDINIIMASNNQNTNNSI